MPTGGGGLLAGVAVAIKTLKPNVKVIVSNSHKSNLINTDRTMYIDRMSKSYI